MVGEGVIEHKAYARVGLLGNSSDVYFGRTISFSLGNFWASVVLKPSKDLVIVPHPTHDLVQFNSLSHLAGLSGSSAIVCAALSCLLEFFDVRHLVKVEVRPNLVLNAEKELGIVTGLQDRVAQVYGGLVYMDFKQKHTEYTHQWILIFSHLSISFMLRIPVILQRCTVMLCRDG